MSDITSAGIGIKIIWPTNSDIDGQINKIQSYLNTKNLEVKISIPDSVAMGLEQLGKMAQSSTIQIDKLGTSINKVSQNKDMSGNITSQMTEIQKSVGETEKVFMKLNEESGLLENSGTQLISNLKQQRTEAEKIEKLESQQIANQEKNIEAEKLQTAEVQRRIALYQDQLALQIRNMQAQYGGSSKTPAVQSDLNAIQSSASGLTGLNAEEFRVQSASINTSLSTVRTGLNETKAASDNFGTDMLKNSQKMLEWTVVGGLIFGSLSQIKEAFSFINTVNQDLTTLQMEMTNTSLNFSQITQQSNALAISMGSTTENVLGAMKVFSNYNSTLQETQDRTKSAVLLANLTGQSVEISAGQILAMEQQFGYAASDSQKMTDILASSARTMKMDYSEAITQVADGIKQVGSLANESKIPLQTMAAMISETASQTQIAGNTIGTAYKTIFSRISNVGDEADPANFKKIEKSFYDIGVAIKSDATTIRPLNDVLNDLAGKWSSLNDVQKQQIATDSAGIRQKNIFIATMDSWNAITKTSTENMDSQGVAAQKQDIHMQSLQAHVNQFSETWKQLYINLSNSDSLKGIVDAGTKILGVFTNLSSVFGTIPTLLTTIVIAGSLFSAKFSSMMTGTLIGSTGAFLGSLKLIETTIVQISNARGISILSATLNVLKASFNEVSFAAIGAKVATIGFQAAATLGLTLAITGIITAFTSWKSSTEDQKKAFEDLTQSIAKLKQETSETSALISQYEELSKVTLKTADETDKLATVTEKLSTLFEGSITGFTSEGKAAGLDIISIKQLAEEKKALLKVQQDSLSASFQSSGDNDLKNLQTAQDGLKKNINDIKDYKALLADINSGKTQDSTNDYNGALFSGEYKDKIAELEKQQSLLTTTVQTQTTALAKGATAFDQTSESVNKLSQGVIRNLIGSISSGNGSMTDLTSTMQALSKVDVSKTVADITTHINDMSKSGSSAADIQQYIKDSTDKLGRSLIGIGVPIQTASTLTSALNKEFVLPNATTASTKVDTLATSFTALQKTMATSSTNVAEAQKVLDDYEKTGHFNIDTLITLAKKHEELIPLLGDEKATHLALTKIIQDEQEASKQAYIEQIMGSTDFYTKNEGLIKNFLKTQGSLRGIDLKGAQTLAEAKLKIEQVLIAQMASKWSKYYDAQSGAFTGSFIDGGRSVMGADGVATTITPEMKAQMKAYSSAMDSAKAGLDKIASTGSGIDFSKIGESASTTADEKAQALADKKAKADAQKHADAVARAEETVAIATQRVNDAKTISQKESALDALHVANANLEAVNKAGATAESIAQARRDAIKSDATNAIAGVAKIQKDASDLIISGYQAQIDSINKKTTAETRATDQLKYQNDLIKQQNDLTNAQNEKNVRVFQDGKWQWEANQTAIQTARDAMSTTQTAFGKFNADNIKTDKIATLTASIKTEQDKQAVREKSASTHITGYASGTSNAEAGVKNINENGIEIIAGNKANFQGGEQVINANDTSRILSGNTNTSLNTIGQSITNNGSLVKRPLDILLSDVNGNIQKFIDSSPKYSHDMNNNIGKSITNNDILVKKPLDNLIADISNSVQRFVDLSPQFGKDTDKNIGDSVTANNALLITPVTALIEKVKTGINAFVTDSYNSGTGMIDELGKGVADSTTNITDIVKTLTDKVVEQFHTSFGIHSPSVVMYKIGEFLMQGLTNGISSNDINSFIQDQFTQMASSGQSVVGGAVSGNVRDWIAQAIKATGIDGSNASALEQIAMHESSGNPNAINLTDSNAMAGHPSQGLMQTIPSTFNAYKMDGHGDITNPIDNAIAAINYMKARYGSVNNVPGIRSLANGGGYVGYQNGTESVGESGLAMTGEAGPELRVLNKNDGIIKNSLTKNLMDWGKINPSNILNSILPKFNMPEFKLNLPNQGNQKSDTHINIEHVELPNVSDGQGFINSIIQLSHVTA